jgi:hypothetical protein
MPNKHTIEVSIPRDDEKRFCDLLHLNGFKTEVDYPKDRPVVIRVCIEAEQFEEAGGLAPSDLATIGAVC